MCCNPKIFFLKSRSDHLELKMLDDARGRVALTPNALPSICFYTFLNTDHRYSTLHSCCCVVQKNLILTICNIVSTLLSWPKTAVWWLLALETHRSSYGTLKKITHAFLGLPMPHGTPFTYIMTLKDLFIFNNQTTQTENGLHPIDRTFRPSLFMQLQPWRSVPPH